MFEDSTFESTGKIKTRSRRWMMLTLAVNGTILAFLILLPLVYPDALPQHTMTTLLMAPEAPKPQPKPEEVKVRPSARPEISEMMGTQLMAPPRIPKIIKLVDPDEKGLGELARADIGTTSPGGDGNDPFGNGQPVKVVRPPAQATVRLTSRLAASTIIYKTVPQYPPIAKAARVEGIVVLEAMISKAGTIEGLHVISGPQMLQQAAMEAVKTWRYRPYMLNGQAVDVETTVNVIFKLQ